MAFFEPVGIRAATRPNFDLNNTLTPPSFDPFWLATMQARINQPPERPLQNLLLIDPLKRTLFTLDAPWILLL